MVGARARNNTIIVPLCNAKSLNLKWASRYGAASVAGGDDGEGDSGAAIM